MKILHTADWHLGRVLHGVSLEKYQAEFLRFFVDLVRKEAPAAVVIAGDIFDRSIAPVSALALMDDTLAQLAALTQVILIPGNHDSAARLGYGKSLYTDKVTVFSQYAQVGTPVVLRDPADAGGDGTVNIYPIPYLEPDLARAYFTDEVSGEPVGRSHQAVNSAAAQRIFTDIASRAGIGLVVAHPFVAGSLTSESERDISVGGVQSIAVETFRDLSRKIKYVACGHLHRPQTLFPADAESDYCVRYAGSPLPFSFSEGADKKSVTRLEVSARGSKQQVEISEIPVPQPYKLISFQGTLAQVEELAAKSSSAEPVFYSVEITDPVRPENLYAKVKQLLPNVMQIRYVATGSFKSQTTVSHTSLGPAEVSQHFFTQALARELTAVEQATINEIWEQLRIEEGAL
ncbi:exonuclease SbcCD subunit D [Gleimia sp. 6138-11-ORH1]|uniref:exonuclease SbcCD subunit D n=1 Tax=Gleimia sp. 6138-11-ORH1 TaxID=2973937 RepID=UPI0021670BF2|nr:exonuclease SbcCD subunit D [Gleimia sp. 6138-11-ORH1]MCS4484068.1 exonuclease SbcCD subunit D [Gleimia sp. 6138-11-ORH1]